MANFGDTLKNALSSDIGQSAVGAGNSALDEWLGLDDDDGGGSSDSLFDEPWFLPAVIVGGLAIVYLVTKKD
jgi:hypothetical protein